MPARVPTQTSLASASAGGEGDTLRGMASPWSPYLPSSPPCCCCPCSTASPGSPSEQSQAKGNHGRTLQLAQGYLSRLTPSSNSQHLGGFEPLWSQQHLRNAATPPHRSSPQMGGRKQRVLLALGEAKMPAGMRAKEGITGTWLTRSKKVRARQECLGARALGVLGARLSEGWGGQIVARCRSVEGACGDSGRCVLTGGREQEPTALEHIIFNTGSSTLHVASAREDSSGRGRGAKQPFPFLQRSLPLLPFLMEGSCPCFVSGS